MKFSPLLKLLLLSGFASILGACASPQADPGTQATEQAANSNFTASTESAEPGSDNNESPGTSPVEAGNLPAPRESISYGQFPEDILTRVIMAELAGQRGYNQAALSEYLALARETNDLGIIRRGARIATFLRDTSASLELNGLWLALQPDSEEALRTQAYQLIAVNRLNDALDLFAQMQALEYDVDFRLISNRAENNIEIQPTIDSLISDFEALLPLYPQELSLRLALAQLYRGDNQLENAYEILHQLAEEMDDSVEILIAEIGILEAMGETRQARRRLESSLNEHADNKQLRFAYARKLVQEGNFRDAIVQFELIVAQDPQDFDMLYSLALLSIEANQLSAAKNYFQRLLVNGQRMNDAHYYMALISDEENNPDLAIDHYLQVNGGNNYLIALRNYLELMIEQDRYREASEHFRELRFRRPEINSTLLTLEGSLLFDAEQYELALGFLGRAISNYPNDIQLLQLRSLVAQELNDLDLMELDLRSMMRLEPNNPSPFNTLGYYLADRTNRFNEAFELIQHAIELSPNDPAILDSLGWVQYKLGRYDEARVNLELAFELYPDHEVAAHLGEVLWVQGQRDAAREIWQAALEAQPDSEFILNTMQRLSVESDS
tara:strand:- start:59564 stop:61399 length:1836 start_codon:yes stop_codon:yes gene_type:complete